jgi:hypothetical protein
MLKILETIGANQKTIFCLNEYFNNIGENSIITENDILRNIKQKLLIDNIIDLLLKNDIIIPYDTDYEDENNTENYFKLLKIDNNTNEEKIIFSFEANILTELINLKKKYNQKNKEVIDNLIKNCLNNIQTTLKDLN